MPLVDRLEEIRRRLRDGIPNEQSVSQGIVLPVLQELNWPVFDFNVVWPEYVTGEGRVDFALCEPAKIPKVFIEVKRPGAAEDGVKQALQYAFHTGVPFVILTDGNMWSFYLPAESGSYEERRIFKLDMLERSPVDAAAVLQRYVDRGRVASGRALESARDEYRSKNRRATARAAIQSAWADIIGEPNDLLVELLAEETESKVGIRPTDADVREFLATFGLSSSGRAAASIQQPPASASTHVDPAPSVAASPKRRRKKTPRTKGHVLILGKSHRYGTMKEAMTTILTELHSSDPDLLARLSEHEVNKGRKRRFIARSPRGLYPDGPQHLLGDCAQLPDGWVVATNNNTATKKGLMEVAVDLAGLKFGMDVKIVEDQKT